MTKPSLDSLYTQTRPSLDSLYAPTAAPVSSSGIPGASIPSTPLSSSSVWGQVSGVFGNLIRSVEQPFVSLAAKPVQLLAKAAGQQDPYANAALGGINVTAPTLKGTAGDLLKAGSEIGAVAAAPATLPGAIAVGGAIGASQGAGTALQNDASSQEVFKQGALGGAVGAATGGAFYGLGKILQAAGDKIQTSIIKPSKADLEDGFSLDTVKKYNLGGSLETTYHRTQSTLNDLSTQLSEKLHGSTNTVNLQDIFKQTANELTDASKLKGFGANAKIANVLQQLKSEISIVGDNQSIPDAQIIKQASGTFGAWQFGKTDPEAKASEIVFNTFYNKLKTAIEKGSPEGVQGLNKQLSELIPVMNAVIRRLPVAQRSNLISLNEMIGLVGSSANPIALGPTVLSILSRSGRFGSLLSKIGPGVSKVGVPASLPTSALPELISGQGQ